MCLEIFRLSVLINQLLFGRVHSVFDDQLGSVDDTLIVGFGQNLFDIFIHQRIDTEKVVEVLIGEDDVVMFVFDESTRGQVLHEELELLFRVFQCDLRRLDF